MNKRNEKHHYVRKLLGFSLFFCTVLILSGAFFRPLVAADMNKDFLAASAEMTEKPTVILDAGHGGIDSGAVSVSGAEEKNLNLEVAKKIGSFLESAGVNVLYTRSGDEMLSSDRGKTRKTKDLLGRVQIAKDNPKAVFVSIHMNTLPIQKYSGLQVFYSDQNTANHPLAQEIQNTVISLIQPKNERKAKNADGKIYILDRISQPAVLIECGFLSNAEEDLLLQNDEYQSRLAFSISRPILNFALSLKEN